MNKNAAIIEGNTTKKFNPVSKVKVSNSDTGESTWIPEDSKETHSLSVIKNGIYYAASEGYTAYDTVTVNVSSETEVNYEGILMDMPDLADLGLYDLDDLEGLDGLDLDLDELQDLENLLLDGDLEEGELPESGSTIKGIDPDSGETLEVGLDEDGNLMEAVLPDHIHIVVPPRKRKYLEGEIIDFTGIHVYLMNANNKRFTCGQYPTGEIPYGELIFPTTVAEPDGTEPTIDYPDYDTSSTVKITSAGSIVATARQALGYLGGYVDEGGVFDAIFADLAQYDGIYAGCVSVDIGDYPYEGWSPFTISVYSHNPVGSTVEMGSTWNAGIQYETYGKRDGGGDTQKFSRWLKTGDNMLVDVFEGTETTSSSYKASSLNSTVDDRTGTQEVPVQWMRSDGEILEDTFEIEIVTEEEPIPEPEPDPYADACDFIWEGKKYCFNKSLARSEVMYSNGTVWQTWLGGQSPPYTVDQALKLKLIVQVGWSGGGSTSGGF